MAAQTVTILEDNYDINKSFYISYGNKERTRLNRNIIQQAEKDRDRQIVNTKTAHRIIEKKEISPDIGIEVGEFLKHKNTNVPPLRKTLIKGGKKHKKTTRKHKKNTRKYKKKRSKMTHKKKRR